MTPEIGAGTGAMAARVSALNDLHRYDDALALAQQWLITDPDDVPLLVQAGQALLGLGRAQEAVLALRHAVRLAPTNPAALCLLAHACVDIRDLAQAHRAATAAVASSSYEPYTFLALSRVESARGQKAAAVAAAERALELAPQLSDAHVRLANALVGERGRTSKRDARRAEGHLEQVLRDRPGDAAVINDLARTRYRRGGDIPAIASFSAAVQADPRLSVAHANLAVVMGVLTYRAHLVLLLAWRAVHASSSLGNVRTLDIGIAVVALGVLGFVVVRLGQAVPRHRAAHLRDVARRQPSTAVAIALLPMAAGALLVSAASPLDPSSLLALLPGVPMILGMSVGFVGTWWAQRGARRQA